jgi:transposase, IS6 family
VQRFTPLLIGAARPCRHAPGDRWFVDETYVKVARLWIYLYRAIDQFGQVIDVLVAEKRDLEATRRFFVRALDHGTRPTEVSTDRASTYPRVLDDLLASACHVTEQYANNAFEADHGRLKSRLRPMRGLKRLRCARVICTGHAFIQNLCRGHYELAVDLDPTPRLPRSLYRTRHRHLNSTQAVVDRAHFPANATAPAEAVLGEAVFVRQVELYGIRRDWPDEHPLCRATGRIDGPCLLACASPVVDKGHPECSPGGGCRS